jgi:hypothetical protein
MSIAHVWAQNTSILNTYIAGKYLNLYETCQGSITYEYTKYFLPFLNNIQKMNIIVSTNRGSAVELHLNKLTAQLSSQTKFIYRPGEKIHILTNLVIDIITHSITDHEHIHVYYLAGLPDLTMMVRYL